MVYLTSIGANGFTSIVEAGTFALCRSNSHRDRARESGVRTANGLMTNNREPDQSRVWKIQIDSWQSLIHMRLNYDGTDLSRLDICRIVRTSMIHSGATGHDVTKESQTGDSMCNVQST